MIRCEEWRGIKSHTRTRTRTHARTHTKDTHTLFTPDHLFDNDDQGAVSFIKLKEGLERLRPHAAETQVSLSIEDWEDFTEHGHLCDENGNLDKAGFEVIFTLTPKP